MPFLFVHHYTRLSVHYDIADSCLSLWLSTIPTSFFLQNFHKVSCFLCHYWTLYYLIQAAVKIILNPNCTFECAWRPFYLLIVRKYKPHIILSSKSLTKTLTSSGWGQTPLHDTSLHSDKELAEQEFLTSCAITTVSAKTYCAVLLMGMSHEGAEKKGFYLTQGFHIRMEYQIYCCFCILSEREDDKPNPPSY